MLRTLKSILPWSGQTVQRRRRRHQFAPTLTGSAASLEGRTMLSGAGGAAVAHMAVDHAASYSRAVHHAIARHAIHHHTQVHHVMAHHAAVHHHTQVHHAMAHHAAVHQARFHVAAQAGHLSKEQRVEAQRAAFAAATGAAAPHDPVITPANASGTITTGLNGTVVSGNATGALPMSNLAGTGLNAETFNGFTTTSGTLPVGLQNAFQVTNGLGLGERAVVAQFPTSGLTRSFTTSPVATSTSGNTALNAINTSTLASALASLLGGMGTGNTLAGTTNTALASELASLLGGTGTMTIGTGTGTTAESPLAALLLSGQVPTAGLSSGTLTSLINTLSFLHSPVNPSPLPFNGSLLFTRSPVNPSPLPFNGSLLFTGSPVNPSPLPFNGSLLFTRSPVNPSPLPFTGTLPFTRSPINPSPLPLNGVLM